MDNTAGRDENLWKIAKKRAAFKKHLLSYIIINAFLWGIWFFSSYYRGHDMYAWPFWVTAGWGIGLFFEFLGAYVMKKDEMAQREYDKLINKQ